MTKGVTSGVSMGAFYLAPILFRHHRMSEGQAFVFFSLLSANALLGNVSTQVLRVIFSISILAPSSIGILFFFPLFSSLFFWLGALSGPFLWPPLPCKTKYKKNLFVFTTAADGYLAPFTATDFCIRKKSIYFRVWHWQRTFFFAVFFFPLLVRWPC